MTTLPTSLKPMRFSRQALERLIDLPAGWSIDAVAQDRSSDEIVLSLAGVPETWPGVTANWCEHPEGRYARFEPDVPGPYQYIRAVKTGRCFFCGEYAARHVVASVWRTRKQVRICRDQSPL